METEQRMQLVQLVQSVQSVQSVKSAQPVQSLQSSEGMSAEGRIQQQGLLAGDALMWHVP
jgi:hypothetical protein